jgi:hypothetical protein
MINTIDPNQLDKLSNAMKLSPSLLESEVAHLESDDRSAEAAHIAAILSAASKGQSMTGDLVTMMQAKAEAEAEADFQALPKKNLSCEEAMRFVLRWSSSYTQMKWLMILRSQMEEREWHSLLGFCWSNSDNIWQYKTDLRKLLGGCACPIMAMMTDEEQAAYSCLPQKLVVYRGCSARHLTGASWTLEPEVARNFTTLDRYGAPDPVLVQGSVHKRDVLALLLERGESEIVAFKVRRVSVVPLAIDDEFDGATS